MSAGLTRDALTARFLLSAWPITRDCRGARKRTLLYAGSACTDCSQLHRQLHRSNNSLIVQAGAGGGGKRHMEQHRTRPVSVGRETLPIYNIRCVTPPSSATPRGNTLARALVARSLQLAGADLRACCAHRRRAAAKRRCRNGLSCSPFLRSWRRRRWVAPRSEPLRPGSRSSARFAPGRHASGTLPVPSRTSKHCWHRQRPRYWQPATRQNTPQ